MEKVSQGFVQQWLFFLPPFIHIENINDLILMILSVILACLCYSVNPNINQGLIHTHTSMFVNVYFFAHT